ncbi:unnamed protein product [Clonostachys rosea]|uniref:Uncharacterized protein n=1 Tax=Bionectria ochroleuca TaxID=29856 RepID=A0ABY6UYX1_BIOOC|nr:unnamed protein product [Clonostachys rosea]
MPIIAKLLSSGLGLTSEAIHKARDGSSSNRPSSSHPPSSSSGPPPEYTQVADQSTHAHYPLHGTAQQSGIDTTDAVNHQDGQGQDEAVWELDDMAERIRPPSDNGAAETTGNEPEEEKIKKREAMVRNLALMAGPPPRPTQRLPCPVILPQRRPRQKDRGFVRAYAPVLSECGISQDVFIRFIEDMDAANKASKWLDAIFVAAGVVGFVPTVSTQVTSLVVQIIAGTAREFQGRSRGNTYLDRVNEEVFIPRGLVAMIMQFKDEVPGQQSGPLGALSSSIQKTFFTKERLDMDQTAAKYGSPDPNMSRISQGMNNMRLTNGKTYGVAELPESAPLVYPDLDQAIHTLAAEDNGGDSQAQGSNSSNIMAKFKSAGEWTNDYLDRRSHAFYEAENPGTSLTTSADNRTAMKSRFNDPNHAANSGSIISVLTGGHIATQGLPQRLAARKEQRARPLGRPSHGSKPGGLLRQKPVKKLLQKDVFYLLVVNIPSQEEVQQSVAQLEQIMGSAGSTSFSHQ